ncbi:MAG: aminoglycoside phosphotransferase family protein [Microlunatus sp.]|nr:aminoglycoside phosphotransferase family protein [Microlunatus sp.]MDN5772133.1 aminoglycoside phosphotransferase family protein [Microlunatus sp.]
MAGDQLEVGAGLSVTDLARIVSAWRGRSGDLDDVAVIDGGGYNTTFRLRLTDGSQAVLRLAPRPEDERPSERSMMRNEWAAIPLLRPVAHLMPVTLVADFTHELVDRDYLIQSFLSGVRARETTKTWAPNQVTGFWRSLGAILAAIHTVTATTFGRIIGPHHDTWSQTMQACFHAVADGCDELRLDSSDLRLLAHLSSESRDLLDQVHRAHLLHGDLIPGNVMVDPDHPGRGIIGIFDCDRAWWGDPAADWTLLTVERLPSESAAGFWTGYGQDLLSDQQARRRRLLYRAYGLGEARLEHARLGRADKVAATYPAINELIAEYRNSQ